MPKVNTPFPLPSKRSIRKFMERVRAQHVGSMKPVMRILDDTTCGLHRLSCDGDRPLGVFDHVRVFYIDCHRMSSRKYGNEISLHATGFLLSGPGHTTVTQYEDKGRLNHSSHQMIMSKEKIKMPNPRFNRYLQKENGKAYGSELPKNYRMLLASRKGVTVRSVVTPNGIERQAIKYSFIQYRVIK